VIVRRSLAQQRTHGTGGMAALGLGEAQASAWLARHAPGVVIAAVNSAQSVTLAGDGAALDRLRPIAEAARLAFVRLDLAYAFHSAAMDPIRAELLAALAGLRSGPPQQVLISTVHGAAVDAGQLDAEYWWRNVRDPVRFDAAIRALLAAGLRHFVEIGPAPVLQGSLRETLHEAKLAGQVLASLSRRKGDAAAFASLAAACHVAGASIAGGPGCDGPVLIRALPRYPWQRQLVQPARSGEAVDLLHPVFEHPLLGFRDPASADRWSAHLSLASEPWLAEHRLDGAAVLPGGGRVARGVPPPPAPPPPARRGGVVGVG
jgi:phthiocerol/phenolphthiocerol synthesis type-I polyketide synthase C